MSCSAGRRLLEFHHSHGITPRQPQRQPAQAPAPRAAAHDPLPLPQRRHTSSRTERVLFAVFALVLVAQIVHVVLLVQLQVELDAFTREIASEVRP